MKRVELVAELKSLASAGGISEKDKLERIKLLLPDSDILTPPHLADPRVQGCLESLADTFEDPVHSVEVLLKIHFFKSGVTKRIMDLAGGLPLADQVSVYTLIIDNLLWRLKHSWSVGLC